MTQVVGPREGRVFHNRLTHTIRVAQVARRLAERLIEDAKTAGLPPPPIDPEVVECAALAHDLGHPPFGHVAEERLCELAEEHGDDNGFEGNAQSFRIVTRLAPHTNEAPGLNLTRASLNAILKYPHRRARKSESLKDPKIKFRRKKFGYYDSDEDAFRFARGGEAGDDKSLEASIMDLADGITYSVHDLEDFHRAGLIPVERLRRNELAREAFITEWSNDPNKPFKEAVDYSSRYENLLDTLGTPDGERLVWTDYVKMQRSTSVLVGNLISAPTIKMTNGRWTLDVAPETDADLRFLQRLTWVYVIQNPSLALQQEGQRQIIERLFKFYLAAVLERRHHLLPGIFGGEYAAVCKGLGSTKRAIPIDKADPAETRLAVDIVASMTDTQAQAIHARISGHSSGLLSESVNNL